MVVLPTTEIIEPLLAGGSFCNQEDYTTLCTVLGSIDYKFYHKLTRN